MGKLPMSAFAARILLHGKKVKITSETYKEVRSKQWDAKVIEAIDVEAIYHGWEKPRDGYMARLYQFGGACKK